MVESPISFGYDAAGNLRWAENADAVVRRSYFPNGQLRGDTLSIRGGGSYGLRFDYNTATGQLRLLHHPENLAGAGKFDEYLYNPSTGLLSGVQDRNENAFSFHHDNTGRLTSTVSVGVTESRVYDVEGRLSTRTTIAPGNVPLISETYTHDARDKVVQVATQPTLNRNTPCTFRQFYSGLGNLVMTDWANVNDPQWQRERFTMDALGNMVHKRTVLPGTEDSGKDHPDYAYTLHPTQGHVTQIELVNISTHQLPDTAGAPRDKTSFSHDGAGNQVAMWQRVDGPSSVDGGMKVLRAVDSRSYYGHDGKLRALQRYDESYTSDPPKGQRHLGRVPLRSAGPPGDGDHQPPAGPVQRGRRHLHQRDNAVRVVRRPAAVGDQAGGRLVLAAGGRHRELHAWRRHRPSAGHLEERRGEHHPARELARADGARHVRRGPRADGREQRLHELSAAELRAHPVAGVEHERVARGDDEAGADGLPALLVRQPERGDAGRERADVHAQPRRTG